MKLAEFTALVEEYTNGQLEDASFSDALIGFLDNNPSVTPTDLLTHTQQLLQQRMLSPKSFRLVSQLITELNIQRVLDDHTASDDETLIMASPPGSGNDDETLIMPSSLDSSDAETLIMPPGENTDGDEETLLVRGQKAHRAIEASHKKNKSHQSSHASNKSLDVGSMLKGRFELIEMIGRGGMGVVFKARDLVKVQAQDSNPYVAIKVLSEAFKKHSRAFIALQREASKAQRLAHPNIATVYDFDRDGDVIYMTMELLHGQPFDKLISQLPQGGLPKPIALRYIEELCHGLAYAHKQQLIHCDLKPANIFLSDSGVVKLLDFGITRVIKNEQRESGDETLFDPASLKALTPAYASVEMFRGDAPDPRDDIYALACVAYELLTGTHPYKKVAAHKALELGLTPPAIKGLTRHQQKALNNALALEREKRTPSVQLFLQGMQPQKSHLKELAIGSVVILAISAALFTQMWQTQRKEDAQLAMIQAIKNGDQPQLKRLLSEIHDADDASKAYLTSILRKEIIIHYQDLINEVTNAKERRYDFPEAMRLLEEVKLLYPDSASLSEAEKQLEAKKQRLVSTLEETYDKLQNKDTDRLLEILGEADPNHPLLKTAETP